MYDFDPRSDDIRDRDHGSRAEALAEAGRELSQSSRGGSSGSRERTSFRSGRAVGTQMAIRATERLEDPEVIAQSCAALTRELLSLVGS